EPLAEQVGAHIIGELDVTVDEQIESTMVKLKALWGGLDMLVHAVAFAEREDLRDRFLNVSRKNFARSLEISAYSLVALARAAEPLMETNGGSILTLTYLGAVRALPCRRPRPEKYPRQCDQRRTCADAFLFGDSGFPFDGARGRESRAAAPG